MGESNIKIGRIGGILKELVELQDYVSELEQKNIQLLEAGQKLEGILINIRSETHYLPDHYYEWINKVLSETDDIITTEEL